MTIFSPTPSASNDDALASAVGTKDGRGCGDNDQPYRFGRRPTTAATFPFTARQYARLLALRGRVADGLTAADDCELVQPRSAQFDSRRPTLFYACLGCGAMVAGAYQSATRVLCVRCAGAGDRDGIARLILSAAGVV